MKDEDFELLGVLIYDGQTDEQTFVIVESLSRLKNVIINVNNSIRCSI